MKIDFKKNKKSGFTLIELLLYIAISSAILLSTSIFLSILLESRVKNQVISEVEGQGVFAMQIMTQAIRNGDSITSPALGSSAASLTVATISPGTNPTIFDLSSGALRIKEGANANVSLTNSRITVSALSFSNLSRLGTPGTVRVSFTLTAVNNSGRNEYSYSKTFIGTATLRQP